MIEEAAHALGLGALYGNQTLLPANVIAIVKKRQRGFVTSCVKLQAFDAFLDQPSESGAYFDAFTSLRPMIFESHCELPGTSG
jgi:hypothetical protein